MTDTLVGYSYGDPRARGGRNPYERFPERSEWTEWELFEREDGSRYRVSWSMARWGERFTSRAEARERATREEA